ncbi:NudC domain-containing protein 1 [Branchiostoma belcheri]|nr:NudC domain-containing protein 1 [Branchiostoma belcheri]
MAANAAKVNATHSLKPDRALIDANFDGYKLSLDPLPQYAVNLDTGIDDVKLNEEEYTYQHIRAFGIHNHLTLDQWNPDSVYYVDNRHTVQQIKIILDTQINPPRPVLKIPCDEPQGTRHNITLHFPSRGWCVLADGAGKLLVIQTHNRGTPEEEPWKIVFSEELCDKQPFTLLHSLVDISHNVLHIEALLLHMDKVPQEHKTDFTVVLEWVTLAKQDGTSGGFKVERVRQVQGKTSPQYAAIECGGRGLFIASDRPFRMVSDTAKDVEMEEDSSNGESEAAKQPAYIWGQTTEDVSVKFTVDEGTTKSDIELILETKRIKLGVKNREPLLDGELCGAVDVEACTWTLDGKELELLLQKREEGPMWPAVVVGDTRGQLALDPDQAAEMNERLSGLTSDQLNASPDPDKKPYNTQELEECDAFPEDSAMLVRLDGETHRNTYAASLSSHQSLFNVQIEAGEAPCLCLRHDVDALIWQPKSSSDNSDIPFAHVATFNALGYVQASKRDMKFAMCAPNFSYASLCDCMRHVYVYRQPTPTASPVRNRKSGRVIGQIAKQQVVAIDSAENIMGFQVSNERLFILTGSKLITVRVNTED